MTDDDEAFIRTIVASPGDDLPRLVYADWLDERGDPRGAYLRLEREAIRTGDVAALRAAAAGLDPVWVGRVSLPPVGVCCDGLAFNKSGTAVTAAALDAVETRFGVEFPPDYRALLLNVNGGVPWSVNHRYSNVDECFYAVRVTDPRRSLESHLVRHRTIATEVSAVELWDAGPGDDTWAKDVIPIADCGHDFVLYYAIRGRYAGLLHMHDRTGDWCRFGFHGGQPPTLPFFLYTLATRGCTIADSYDRLDLDRILLTQSKPSSDLIPEP